VARNQPTLLRGGVRVSILAVIVVVIVISSAASSSSGSSSSSRRGQAPAHPPARI